MNNPTIMSILIVYSILALVLLISTVFMITKMHRQNRIWRMMITDLTTRNKILSDARDRQQEVGQVFSKILFDLAHSTNPETIQWKLMCIRQVEDALVYHPGARHYYDDSYHNWLINMITRPAPQCKHDILNTIRKWTKGYYIMDPITGENITNLIGKLIDVEDARKDNEQIWLQQVDEFTKFVQETRFNFPIDDTKPKEIESARNLSFEKILAEINSDLNLWDLDTTEEMITNGNSESNSETEEHITEDAVVQITELQGQEDQPVYEEDSSEDDPVPVGAEVIVMCSNKAV